MHITDWKCNKVECRRQVGDVTEVRGTGEPNHDEVELDFLRFRPAAGEIKRFGRAVGTFVQINYGKREPAKYAYSYCFFTVKP